MQRKQKADESSKSKRTRTKEQGAAIPWLTAAGVSRSRLSLRREHRAELTPVLPRVSWHYVNTQRGKCKKTVWSMSAEVDRVCQQQN